MIFAGKYREAHNLIGDKMMARPLQQMPYEPVGDLKLGYPGHGMVNDYRRELDLDTATVSVRYTVNGAARTTHNLVLAPAISETHRPSGRICFNAGQ